MKKTLLQKIGLMTAGLAVAGMLWQSMAVTSKAEPRVLGSQPAAATEADEAEEAAEAAPAATVATVTSATVTGDSVNIRSNASTSGTIQGKVKRGDELTVTGEETGADGKVWYAITSGALTGYIRSDFVEAHVTEVPVEVPEVEETPVEEEPVEEAPAAAPAENENYYVKYADDGSGNYEWFLADKEKGVGYKISELLGVQEASARNQSALQKTIATLRYLIIALAVVAAILLIVCIVLALKLRNAGSRYDDDDEDDEDEEEEEEEDDEDEEEEVRPAKKKGLFGKSRRRVVEEDDDDEDEDDEDEEEEEEEEELPRRKPAPRKDSEKSWKSKNFVDNDDLEFEFLDLK